MADDVGQAALDNAEGSRFDVGRKTAVQPAVFEVDAQAGLASDAVGQIDQSRQQAQVVENFGAQLERQAAHALQDILNRQADFR